MLTSAKEVTFGVSDLHLGEGADSLLEDFKHHPAGCPIGNTVLDYVLDKDFIAFVNWIKKNCAGKKVCLKFLGDAFDFVAVVLETKTRIMSLEDDDLEKFKKIVLGHPGFFRALRSYCESDDDFRVDFYLGNHDLALAWPAVQKEIVELISPAHPERVRFLYDETDRGIYFRHGESEPHDRVDPKHIIVKRADLIQLLQAEHMEKLVNEGELPTQDILNVPLAHYLTTDLENPLKRADLLVGRMHVHGFVWLDALLNLFHGTWYRHRWFSLIAAYFLLQTIIKHTFFAIWPLKWKSGIKKIAEVLWWTIVGMLTNATPRDVAFRVLSERDEVDVVVFGHEHRYTQETRQYGRSKTYINTGTWIEMWRVRKRPAYMNWQRFPIFGQVFEACRHFYHDADLVPVRRFPVLVISYDENNERTLRLMRFDEEEHVLKELC